MRSEPESCLLRAFRILHVRGYEGLNVYADIDLATGHWRCALGVIGLSVDRADAMESFHYSSASGWYFFDPKFRGSHRGDREHHEPEWVADMLSVRFPDLMEAAMFECKPYVAWYKRLLEACGPDGVFYASSQGRDPREVGFIIAAPKEDAPKRFPLAPVW
jgi:hypothetical protein